MSLRLRTKRMTFLAAVAPALLGLSAVNATAAHAVPAPTTCRTTQVISGGSLYAVVCIYYAPGFGRPPSFQTVVTLTSHATGYAFTTSNPAWISGSNSSGYFDYYAYNYCDLSGFSHQTFDNVQVCHSWSGYDGQPYQQGQMAIGVNGTRIKVFSPTVPVS